METESGPVSRFVQSRRVLALEIELKHRCVVGGGGWGGGHRKVCVGGVLRKVCVGGVRFFVCVWCCCICVFCRRCCWGRFWREFLF